VYDQILRAKVARRSHTGVALIVFCLRVRSGTVWPIGTVVLLFRIQTGGHYNEPLSMMHVSSPVSVTPDM
jgi:hypothetical protein